MTDFGLGVSNNKGLKKRCVWLSLFSLCGWMHFSNREKSIYRACVYTRYSTVSCVFASFTKSAVYMYSRNRSWGHVNTSTSFKDMILQGPWAAPKPNLRMEKNIYREKSFRCLSKHVLASPFAHSSPDPAHGKKKIYGQRFLLSLLDQAFHH